MKILNICLIVIFMNSLHQQAYSYLENISHGYVNCMSCHVSPNGGGVLNDYGRSLSRELMSTWGWENSEEPLFGAVDNKEWFKLGGDVRYIQTYFENSELKQAKQFNMQQNLEFAIKTKSIWSVFTLGTRECPQNTKNKGEFLSERHYLLYANEQNEFLRLGKFRLVYGYNDPNHTRPVKQLLGFGSNSETYNLEASKFFDFGEVFISSSLGRIDQPRNFQSEKSFSLQYNQYIGESSKLGGSLLFGESLQKRRNLYGLHGFISPFEKASIQIEIDLEESFSAANQVQRTNLFTGAMTLGFEIYKGLMSLVMGDYAQTDLNDAKSKQTSYGLGFRWLPIPHFEIQSEIRQNRRENSQVPNSHSGWVLFHFYI